MGVGTVGALGAIGAGGGLVVGFLVDFTEGALVDLVGAFVG